MLLEGKNAVITGCKQGIGFKTLQIFAAEGANIWAFTEELTDELNAKIKELQNKYNIWIKPLVCDYMDEESIKVALKSVMSDKQPVDCLVNVAGITHNALFHMTSMEDFKRVFQIDFLAQMIVTQFITKLMLRNKKGSVIFVASDAGVIGNAGQVAYAAAKGALISAMRTISSELGSRGIRANAIAPGVIDTAMTQALTEEQRDKIMLTADIKRLGTPEEVGKLLAFLASDYSSYITGQVIRINGGIK